MPMSNLKCLGETDNNNRFSIMALFIKSDFKHLVVVRNCGLSRLDEV